MSSAEEDAYKAGVIDGKLSAIEDILSAHDRRIGDVEKTQRTQEKVGWILIGAIGLIQALPSIKGIL